MESYVNDLLKNADLTVLTKKHIRLKYKEHVGRELLPEEKSRINDMVYAFVKELSALQYQTSSPVQPVNSPEGKKDSPGNKENKSNEKSSKIIIKGQVVDRNDLYKRSNKERKPSKEDLSADKQDKHDKQDKPKKTSPDNARPDKITPKSPYARAVKLKINDVMSAVLGDAESSSDVSSVSSLSDTSLSDVDEKPDTDMTEALQKLNEAREKKIQMSTEKKRKLRMGRPDNKVKRSLPLKGDRVEDLKNANMAEDSETLSLISEISASENDTKAESRLGNSLEQSATSKRIKKTELNDEVDSGEIKVKKTSESYLKNKSKLVDKDRRFMKLDEKKKKLVKRKIKKLEICSDSDSDGEKDVKNKLNKTKSTPESKKSKNSTNDINHDSKDKIKTKTKIETSKDTSEDKSDDVDKHLVDSDSSTGDTPLAKKKGFKNSKLKNKAENNNSNTPLIKKKAKCAKIDSDSELSTGDTPLVKKKVKLTKLDSDSELSTGDTPLAKKKLAMKNDADENDSEVSTGDTPLIKKKVNKMDDMKSLTNLRKLKSKKYVTEIRKTYPKRSRQTTEPNSDKILVSEDKKEHITSESSSGDMPLAQLKKKQARKELDSTGRSDCKESMDVQSDSESTESPSKITDLTNDIELKSKAEEEDSETILNGKVSKKRKLSSNSNISKENTPILKKKQRKRTASSENGENESDNDLSDSELSDVSTGDTPLVKKRTKLRKNAAKAKTNSKTKSEALKSDMDSQEVTNDSDHSVVDNSVESLHKTNDVCNNDGEFVSPLKVKKSKSKIVTLDSSSSDEEEKQSLMKENKQKKSKTKINSDKTKVDEDDSIEEDGTVDSDDSDDIPLASIKSKIYDLSSDSEDDVPLSAVAAQGKQVKKDENLEETEENMTERTYLRLLRQICRECRMFVRNDRELAGCDTDQEKIDKLEQMLRDVGMKGKPSMRKAEEVKLQKEAKELSADNIISSETGRVMRKVKSIYARRTISPLKPAKPAMKNPFVGLRDIVDSDGTESTD